MNPIYAALLAVFGALMGTLLTNYLTRGSDTEKWRRDHALEAYFQMVEAVEVVRFETDRIYISTEYQCGTDEHKKQAELILDKVVEMDRRAQRVFLLAPNVVIEPLSELTAHVGEQIVRTAINCPKIEESQRQAATKKLPELLARFRNAARNDLNIHPPQYSFEEWQLRDSKKPWWQFWG
jgi:hypothetical protein